MTRLLWLAPTSMNLEPIITSTDELSIEASVHWYDQHGTPPDAAMIKAARRAKPDIIAYIGTAGGPYCPMAETLREIKNITPLVHLCGDASDLGWRQLLDLYRGHECFTCTVNFDGNKDWPSGKNDLTLLTPINPAYYRDLKPLSERPIKVGFAGGYQPGQNSLRERVVQAIPGIAIFHRDETYGSYQKYADFLKECQIIVNVSESASGNSNQVKGRVLESAHAGCILMNSCNLEPWFDEECYLHFKSPENADVMSTTPLSGPMETRANNLRRHVLRDHGAESFWNTVLTHVL